MTLATGTAMTFVDWQLAVESDAGTPPRNPGDNRLPKPVVLIADPDSLVRRVLSLGLAEGGFCVLRAGTVTEALNTCRRGSAPIDAVLLDADLLRTDVYLIDELREAQPATAVCLMANDLGELWHPLCPTTTPSPTVDWIVYKPFHLPEVVALLWQLIGRVPSEAR